MGALEAGRIMELGEGRAVQHMRTLEAGMNAKTLLTEVTRGLVDDFPQTRVLLDGKLVEAHPAFIVPAQVSAHSVLVWVPDNRILIVAPLQPVSFQKSVPEVGKRAEKADLATFAEHTDEAIDAMYSYMETRRVSASSLQQG